MLVPVRVVQQCNHGVPRYKGCASMYPKRQSYTGIPSGLPGLPWNTGSCLCSWCVESRVSHEWQGYQSTGNNYISSRGEYQNAPGEYRGTTKGYGFPALKSKSILQCGLSPTGQYRGGHGRFAWTSLCRQSIERRYSTLDNPGWTIYFPRWTIDRDQPRTIPRNHTDRTRGSRNKS